MKKTFKERIIISSDSKWKSIFDIFIIILVGYSCATNMYYVSFGNPTSQVTITLDFIFEVFFWVDFFLNFFQGFKHEDTYEHITDMKEIAKKYLFGWLMIDAVSIFPFKNVLSLFNADSDNAQGLKLIRLARMPRMGKLIDINRIKNVLKSLGGNNNNDEEIVK